MHEKLIPNRITDQNYTPIMSSRRVNILYGIIVILMIFLFISHSSNKNCSDNSANEQIKKLPIIYAVTPTYYRPVQKAELTRFVNVLFYIFQKFEMIL